jgi:acyl-CoA thioester hydrolase
LAEQGIAFAVRSMQLEFIGAAHIDDLLLVRTQVVAATGARLKLEQKISCLDVLLTSAQLDVVAIKTSGGPARLPAVLRALAP